MSVLLSQLITAEANLDEYRDANRSKHFLKVFSHQKTADQVLRKVFKVSFANTAPRKCSSKVQMSCGLSWD